MRNINDLLNMNSIVEKIDENKVLMNQYLEKFSKTLYPGEKGASFNTSMYDVDIFNNFIEMENTGILDIEEIEEYRKCALQYADLNQKLENFIDGKHIDLIDFYRYKDQFLEELVSTQHISNIGEEPQEFFKKLIELYGEKELASFSHTGTGYYYDSGEDYDIEEDYYGEDYDFVEDDNLSNDFEEENSAQQESVHLFTLYDFIHGHEDEIISDISSNELRKVVLSSKLKFLSNNSDKAYVKGYIQEYIDGAVLNGKQADSLIYVDEYGDVDEDTLNCFSQLPISDDKNFYLYLATHLKEMGIPFEKFIEYIPSEFFDDKFGPELANVSNTGVYTYQNEFAERNTMLSIEDIIKIAEDPKSIEARKKVLEYLTRAQSNELEQENQNEQGE